jgi:ATP-dependent RNA helicase SUPV3L1/SUV3
MRALSQDARAALRKLGVRFGAYHLYLPALLKPAPRSLAAQLWALKHGGLEITKGLDEVPHLASSGRTSFPADATIPRGLYLAAGFRVSGERAVRVDILERLADLIRPAIAYRPGVTAGEPPAGSADSEGFVVTVGMTSLAGCSGEAFASILRSLGYVSESRSGPAITVPLLPAASRAPIQTPIALNGAASDAEKPEDESVSALPGETFAELVSDPTDEKGLEEPVAQDEETESPLTPIEVSKVEVAVAVTAAPEVSLATDASEQSAGPEPDVAFPGLSADSSSIESPPAEPHLESVDPAPTAPQVDLAPSVDLAPPEPAIIEVWRPQRHHQGGKRSQGERARGPSRPFRLKEDQEIQSRPSGEHRRREEQRKKADNRPPQRRPQAATNSVDEPKPAPQAGVERPRFAQRDAPRREDRNVPTGGRPKRERLPDPDSPFAKLLALKAELEAKSRKD